MMSWFMASANYSNIAHCQHALASRFLTDDVVTVRRTENVVQFGQRFSVDLEARSELALFQQLAAAIETLFGLLQACQTLSGFLFLDK